MTTRTRIKMAPQGWAYQARGIEFSTSTLSSVTNEDVSGTDIGDVSIFLYDDQDTEITVQATAATDCVKTVVEWEPTYDYELIGGSLGGKSASGSPLCRVYIIATPDIPAGSGGSKVFINGLDMEYLDSGDRLIIDGRTPKRLNYNATYHTNKIQLVLKHTAGYTADLLLVMEHFRP